MDEGRKMSVASCPEKGGRGWGGLWQCLRHPVKVSPATHLVHPLNPLTQTALPICATDTQTFHFRSRLLVNLLGTCIPSYPPPKGPTSTQYWNIPHPMIFDRLLLRLRCSKRACKLNGWQLIENRKPLIWHICGLCLIYAVRTVYTVGSRCCGLMDCRLSFSQLTAALDNLCPQFRKVSRPVKYEVANRMAGRCRGISNFNAQIVANENV